MLGTFTTRNAVITTRYVTMELTSYSLLQDTNRRFSITLPPPNLMIPRLTDQTVSWPDDYWKQNLSAVGWRDDTVTILHHINYLTVRTATRYWQDGPGIESRWRRDFPRPSRSALWPTQPPIQCVHSYSDLLWDGIYSFQSNVLHLILVFY